MKKNKIYILLSASAFLCNEPFVQYGCCCPAKPKKISFQGFLKDENGKAVKNDTMTFFFQALSNRHWWVLQNWIEKQNTASNRWVYIAYKSEQEPT